MAKRWPPTKVSADRGSIPLASTTFRISHARGPSAKIVEGVLGAVQNRMERMRGYCGRDERKDCPEFTRAGLNGVKAGHHPSEYFYSYNEWLVEVAGIFNYYNDAPQRGKRLQGLSPREAFAKWRGAPPIRLDDSTRF